MERNSFIFYQSFYEAIKDLSDDIQLEVFKAIIKYGLYGVDIEQLSPIANCIFTLIKPQLDANNKRYENGQKGGSKNGISNNPYGRKGKPTTEELAMVDNLTTKKLPNDNDNDNVNDNVNVNVIKKETKKEKTSTALVVFHPPTLDEVQAYITAKGYNIDAEAFIAYYDSNGWMVGRNKMKSWKAAIVTWVKKEYSPVNNNNHYDRQQSKQAAVARQEAAIDNVIAAANERWRKRRLAEGASVEDVATQPNI